MADAIIEQKSRIVQLERQELYLDKQQEFV